MLKIFKFKYVLPYEEVRKEREIKIIAKNSDDARIELRKHFGFNNVYIISEEC